MGVPALFRWLSKKYPKIIYPVEEEEETKVSDNENNSVVTIPVDITHPNPNGTEFDNLYLDMNGIVHPCTHPEGKPAPETEEEMMVEVFKYTERVVNMIRPRKLLFMAIDGVAPRAKMNQQRSRRFRSAQEAKEKEDARKESVAIWQAMGKEVSEEEKKVPWDSNAITPGTPFMTLLAASLRYWVVKKINTDPGWKTMQVIISDAGVPGEGEHKIMDFIRRQRTNPGHDPNTRHVIYGLDADLIMLALATHEPYFRVLREDVFANDTSPSACRMCGQEGHYAAQCTGTKAEIQKKPPAEKKPFIFLDVAILREYLEVELNVQQATFPFSLEQAIDDWVLLIFFVGNDFLPHLPSLEIREGAIDTLLKIWKQELPRMGGYLTSHGQLELSRAQIILEGLAKREDEIFRRRREAEERQDQNAKRRKLEQQNNKAAFAAGPSATMALTTNPTPPISSAATHHSLPQRPSYDFAANADSIGLGVAPTAQSVQNIPTAAQALAGSNRDVVANRRAIRMANMSAAEVLKAEMSGLMPVKSLPAKPPSPVKPVAPPTVTLEAAPMSISPVPVGFRAPAPPAHEDDDEVPGLGNHRNSSISVLPPPPSETNSQSMITDPNDADAGGDLDSDVLMGGDGDNKISVGSKRKLEEGTDDADDVVTVEEDDDVPDASGLALKVRPDGTVEQEDTVKLWEPGYKERYYRQKFGVELTDTEFRNGIVKAYIEGLAWVLQYYYQGTPSWQWYYPYHFAPFAADFEDVDKMDLKFILGQPFKPFEQLMGVFPAASRQHIPKAFHSLMTDEHSPIIDFYPPTFEIDMNGKKMAWQGVALLPFIDPKRLLDAMAVGYPNLTEDEVKRNRWGNDVIFASNEHPVYPFYEALYGKRKNQEPVPIDVRLTGGISGSVLRNPDCIPGSTYYCPFEMKDLPDIQNDRSLSALYFFPKQLTPHRSVMLPGVKKAPRILSAADLETTRNGGRGRGRGRGGWSNEGANGRSGNWANGGADRSRNDPYHSRPNNYGQGSQNSYGNDRGGGGGRGYGGGGNGYQQPRAPYQTPPQQQYGGYGGYGGPTAAPSYSGYGSRHGGPPSRGAPPGYGGYGSGYGANGGGGGYGGGGASQNGGYGGYGGYSGQPVGNSALAYQGNSRGGAPYNGRGRGRGW